MTYDETNGTNPGDAALARELGAALRQASTGFQPDPEALAEAGLRRGRTRLWRRRAASVTAVAAVAAVGLGATTLTGLTGDDDEGGPVESLTAAPWSEEDLADTLAARLPDGVEVVESDGAGTDETGDPWVWLTLEDAAGEPWTLSFDLMRWISDDWTQLAGCVEDWSDCEEQTLEDGWILTAYHGVEEAIAAETEDVVGDTGEDAPAAPESFATWGAWLEGPAEWAPDVTGAYAYSLTLMPGEAGTGPVAGAGTDAEPPLTEDELAAILRDPVWRDLHVEADAEHGAPTDDMAVEPYSDIAPEDLHRTFADLAPEGLEITPLPDPLGGESPMTVDDGRGPGLIDVTVYEPMYEEGEEPTDEELAELEDELGLLPPDENDGCEQETLEDGRELILCAYPGDEEWNEAPSWSVDVYYPDGWNLTITQLLSPGYDAEPTRTEPMLTLDQLREIAIAPEWNELIPRDSTD